MPSEVDSYIIKALAEALEPAVVEAVLLHHHTIDAADRGTPDLIRGFVLRSPETHTTRGSR